MLPDSVLDKMRQSPYIDIMTKGAVCKILNMNDTELAELFGISRSAVTQWGDDGLLPLARQLQLKHELRPRLFRDTPTVDPLKAHATEEAA